MIVNANGSIDGTQVLNFGKEYTSSPTMNVLYRSSNISQEGSVSIIKVVSPGVNFLADGVLRVTGIFSLMCLRKCTGANYLAGDISASGGDGSSFLATFTVNANGSIDGTQVLNFGKEYTSSPTVTGGSTIRELYVQDDGAKGPQHQIFN